MSRWSDKLSKAHQTRRANKYGAVKVKEGSDTFDSKGEHEFYKLLSFMQSNGLIKQLIHHPPAVQLTRFVTYKPDFLFFDIKRGIYIYAEFKGLLGERYRVIKNLWKEFGPLYLQEWKKQGNHFVMTDEIIGTK